jgi:hypothetical protein
LYKSSVPCTPGRAATIMPDVVLNTARRACADEPLMIGLTERHVEIALYARLNTVKLARNANAPISLFCLVHKNLSALLALKVRLRSRSSVMSLAESGPRRSNT